MNTFEVAVLRILIKRQQPLKLSALVGGFPDDCDDSILSAISSLKLQGYVILEDYQPEGYVSINKERRKEILQIVDSNIYLHESEASHTRENYSATVKEKKGFARLVGRHPISQGIRAIAISSLLVFGLISAIVASTPTTSPDTEFVTYPQHAYYNKWSKTHGANDHDHKREIMAASPDPSSPASFVALKDCNQEVFQQQT